MTLRRVPASLFLLTALFGPVAGARAQGELPASVMQATSPTPEQLKQIADYAQEWGPKLDNADAAAIRAARDHLLAPLRVPNVAVRPRQEYADRLAPELEKLVASPDEHVAYNALRVCGELATARGAELVSTRLADPKPPMRLFAAAQLKRTLEAVANARPAIVAADLNGVIDRLGQRMAAETEVPVLDTVARALMAGTLVPETQLPGVRAHAFDVLCREATARTRALGPAPASAPTLDVLLRAATMVRDSLANPGAPVGPAGMKAAGELSGALLAYVHQHLKDYPQGNPQAREGAVEVVRVAEAAIFLVVQPSDPSYQDTRMDEDFKKATREGDNAFVDKARAAIQALEKLGMGPFLK
jgi:hypothetical protein